MSFFRIFSLCAALIIFASTGCDAESPDVSNQSSATDTGASVDTVMGDSGAVDAAMSPNDDIVVSNDVPSVPDIAIEDTAVIEDVASAPDMDDMQDVQTPEDTSSGEDDAVVVFGDGFTVPALGEAACDNKEDILLLEEQTDLIDTMKTCALNCLGEEACATDCVVKETGISAECAGCFGSNIACTMKNCALHCLDATSPKCLECQETNCNNDFKECAGVVIPGS